MAHAGASAVRRRVGAAKPFGRAPATRPGIIETLFHRSYIERRGKTIVSTALGRQLVACLPEVATTPDMTAVWETSMRAITEDKDSLGAFLERISSQIQFLVRQAKAEGKVDVPRGTESPIGTSTSRRKGGGPPKDRPSAR